MTTSDIVYIARQKLSIMVKALNWKSQGLLFNCQCLVGENYKIRINYLKEK